MKKLALLLTPVVALALTGCGVIAAFIPDQEVGDIFGIGDVNNPARVEAATFVSEEDAGPFLPAAVVSDYEGTELKFADRKLPDMYGFSIAGLRVVIGIGDTITLEGETASGVLPEEFTLTSFEAYVHISDAEDVAGPVEVHFEQEPLNITFKRVNDSNKYVADASKQALQNALTFDLLRGHGRTVKDILTLATEGGTNTAYVKVRVTADSDGDLDGLTPVFEVMNTSTKVNIGG